VLLLHVESPESLWWGPETGRRQKWGGCSRPWLLS
jgi:hypothetical protein